MNKKSFGSRIVAAPYMVWAAIFIVVPLLIMAYFAFTDGSGNFTVDNFMQIARFKKAFALSIIYAVIATIITLLLAYPMAYYMTKLKISSQRMVMMLIMLPMWMNFLIRTYSWITILANTGLINKFLGLFGIGPLQLINTPGAVILGMVYDFIPYMILPIYTAMSKIDNSLLEAASDLGSNSWSRIRRVIMPLSLPGVISGITMVFVPSISTFYISQKLGGNKDMLIGDAIEYLFNTGPQYYNVASTLSLILMVMILVCTLIMNRFGDDEEVVV
ncbi:MAG: ABC transporter permease [Clostridia bacterium]|nr:ABC transporter permease [Clostridia bacterium]